MTTKHNYLPNYEDYDALIFFHWNIAANMTIPDQSKRRPEQLYIVHYMESPQRSVARGHHSNVFPNMFNLTMSYRLDSDIVWPYGRVYDKVTKHQVAPSQDTNLWKPVNKNFKASEGLRNTVDSKRKLIAWVVSNCHDDPSERWEMVQSLNKTIQVDIYGKCETPCNADCKKQLGTDYYFYLAAENSFAVDYVSEKAYTMLNSGLIPIVYGGVDYQQFLPTKSYINAEDFKTTQELGEFLLALTENTEEYLSYFWWTEHYSSNIGQGYADLCGKVKEWRKQPGVKIQFYSDLERWEHQGQWLNRTIQFS